MGNMIFLVNTTQLRENIESLFSATLGGFNSTGELLGELFAAAKSLQNTGVGCHLLLQCMKVKSESEVAQSCLTLSYPMDCSLPGSSVHGIFQARVLEWGAITFSLNSILRII